MGDVVWATVGDTNVVLHVEDLPLDGGEKDVGFNDGQDVLFGSFDFDDVVIAIEQVAYKLGAAWEKVKPKKASVEFSMSISAKTGKLVGVLVEGGGEGVLKVNLEWGS